MRKALAVLVSVLTLSACAASRPVLYPNAHLARVGQGQAEQDVAACRGLADQYIASGGAGTVAGSTAVGGGAGAAIGAAGGAVRGSAGTGAAVGAARFIGVSTQASMAPPRASIPRERRVRIRYLDTGGVSRAAEMRAS